MVEFPIRALLAGPGGSVWSFKDKDREYLWSFSTGHGIFCTVVDDDGNVYCCGIRYGAADVWKFDREGNKLWEANVGTSWFSDMAVDSNGNVFIVGWKVGGKTLWKRDGSDGSHIWSIDAGWRTTCVAVDGSDNVFVGYARDFWHTDDSIKKFAGLDGAPLASYDTGSTPRGMVVGGDNNLIAVGEPNSGDMETSKSAWKLTNDLSSLIWSIKTFGENGVNYGLDVALDSLNNVYIGGFGAWEGGGIASAWKYSSGGVCQWYYYPGSSISGIAVGIHNEIYVTGPLNTAHECVWKLDDDGNLIEGFNPVAWRFGGLSIAVDDVGAIEEIAATPTARGTGYAADDILDVSEGSGGQAKVLTVDGSGVVLTLLKLPQTPGTGYTVGTGKVTTGGTGSGCTIEITAIVYSFLLGTGDYR